MRVLISSDIFLDYFFDNEEFVDNAEEILHLIDSSIHNIEGCVTDATLTRVFYETEESNGTGKKALEIINSINNIRFVTLEKSHLQMLAANYLELEQELVNNISWCVFSQEEIDGIISRESKKYANFLQILDPDNSFLLNKIKIFEPDEFIMLFKNLSDSSIELSFSKDINPNQLIPFWYLLLNKLLEREVFPELRSSLLLSICLISFTIKELRKKLFLILAIGGTLAWIGIFPGSEVGVLSEVVDGALIYGGCIQIAVMSELLPGTSTQTKTGVGECIELEFIDYDQRSRTSKKWILGGYLVGALAVGLGIFATTSLAKNIGILIGLSSLVTETLFVYLKIFSVTASICLGLLAFFGKVSWTHFFGLLTLIGSLWFGGEFLVLAGTGSSVGALVVADVCALTITGCGAFFGKVSWSIALGVMGIGILILAGASGGIGGIFLTAFGGIALTIMGTQAFIKSNRLKS